jgi:hypothetical protein
MHNLRRGNKRGPAYRRALDFRVHSLQRKKDGLTNSIRQQLSGLPGSAGVRPFSLPVQLAKTRMRFGKVALPIHHAGQNEQQIR